MKNLLYILLFLPALLIAQTPQEFKYQAVVRDANGDLKVNSIISVKSSILSGSSSGSVMYSETQTISTNGYGVVSLNIGSGTVVSGNFTTIGWGANTYYVKTELDISGGTNYQFMGTSQILSVPYALHSKTSATSLDDNDKSSTNEIQQLSIANDTIKLSSGGEVYLGSYLDNTDQQTLSLQGNQLVISNGNSVTLSGTIDLDADPTNELQLLNLSNDTLYLSNGNYVVIPPDNDADPNNELQVLNLSNDTLYLSNGNYVVIPPDNDADPNNEIQTLSNTAGSISISSGNTITLQDSSAINELQNLSINGNDISISNGNMLTLPNNNDNDSTNELQNLSINGSDISISNGNTVTIPPDLDSDTTNELQTLSFSNDTLSISNGNNVVIDYDNFDFIYPDGKGGITPVILQNGPYTPPPNYNLYITGIYISTGNGLEISSNIIFKGSWNHTQQGNQPGGILMPFIVSDNQTVTGFDGLIGFLVNAKVQPICVNVETNPYTVPLGKILVITNVYSLFGQLKINGVNVTYGYYNHFLTISGCQPGCYSNRLDQPIFADENSVLTNYTLWGDVVINGYLMDK